MIRVLVAILATLALVGCSAMAAVLPPSLPPAEATQAAAQATLTAWPTARPTATPDSTATPRPRPTATAMPAAQVEAVSASAVRLGTRFWEVNGAVKNVSDQPLEKLTVVVTTLDAQNKPVGVDSAAVEFSPVQPGQTAPFSIVVRDRPGADAGLVEFKLPRGGALPIVKASLDNAVFVLRE